jgi:hypothetical protein
MVPLGGSDEGNGGARDADDGGIRDEGNGGTRDEARDADEIFTRGGFEFAVLHKLEMS